MANETAIGWTDLSWNPVHGCSVVSPGCAHCYAETLSLQRGHTTKPWTPENAAENVLVKPHKLKEPFSGAKVWRGLGEAAARAGKTDGKLVFVNSMSDLFHEEVSDEFIGQVFATMARASKHTFQILTKRPERMHDVIRSDSWEFSQAFADGYADRGTTTPPWPLPNVWLGVSIENRRYVDRADLLRETPAAVRFISAEPLLGPLVYDDGSYVLERGAHVEHRHWADEYTGAELDLCQIDWLIVGGESGPGYRRMNRDWAYDLKVHLDCVDNERPGGNTAFFVKQGSGPRAGQQGGLPDDLWRYKQFPRVREAVVA
jgi:protein gp37